MIFYGTILQEPKINIKCFFSVWYLILWVEILRCELNKFLNFGYFANFDPQVSQAAEFH